MLLIPYNRHNGWKTLFISCFWRNWSIYICQVFPVLKNWIDLNKSKILKLDHMCVGSAAHQLSCLVKCKLNCIDLSSFLFTTMHLAIPCLYTVLSWRVISMQQYYISFVFIWSLVILQDAWRTICFHCYPNASKATESYRFYCVFLKLKVVKDGRLFVTCVAHTWYMKPVWLSETLALLFRNSIICLVGLGFPN